MARATPGLVLSPPEPLAQPSGSASTSIVKLWAARRVPGGGHSLIEVDLPEHIAAEYLVRAEQPDPLSHVLPRIMASIAKESEKG